MSANKRLLRAWMLLSFKSFWDTMNAFNLFTYKSLLGIVCFYRIYKNSLLNEVHQSIGDGDGTFNFLNI